MDYKIGVCDNSEADRKYIAALAARWAANTGHTAQVDAFVSAENFMFHYAEEKDYDILLLDIEMGRMDGVSMAKKLRQENDTVQIIFITGYSDYVYMDMKNTQFYLSFTNFTAGKKMKKRG